ARGAKVGGASGPLTNTRRRRQKKTAGGPPARRFDRRQRVHHRPRTDRNAGRAQRAREMDDVFGETAAHPRALIKRIFRPADVIGGEDRSRSEGKKSMHDVWSSVYSAARKSARTSSMSSFAFTPSMRAISS